MCRFSKLLLFSFFFCKDGSDRLMKRASYSCCNFLCIVLAAAYLKYRLCRLSCLPFVWGLFFIVTHTHTHTHAHTHTRTQRKDLFLMATRDGEEEKQFQQHPCAWKNGRKRNCPAEASSQPMRWAQSECPAQSNLSRWKHRNGANPCGQWLSTQYSDSNACVPSLEQYFRAGSALFRNRSYNINKKSTTHLSRCHSETL